MNQFWKFVRKIFTVRAMAPAVVFVILYKWLDIDERFSFPVQLLFALLLGLGMGVIELAVRKFLLKERRPG